MTTRTIIRKSTESVTGYELVIIDNGVETVILLNDRPKNEPNTLILPENPSNRKYFNDIKVEKAGGEIELTYKESKTYGPRHKKSLEEYMTEDELELKYQYERMLEEVEQRRRGDEESQRKEKPKTKTKAQLQEEIDALMARLNELTSEEA